MLDLVVRTCQTRLMVKGPLPRAKDWKLLASRLDFPWEDVEKQIQCADVSVFVQTLRADLLETVFRRSTMPGGMLPFKCRPLFDALQVVVKVSGLPRWRQLAVNLPCCRWLHI